MENETEDKEDGEIYFPNLHDRMPKNTVYIHTTRSQLILPVDWSEDARRGSQVYTK